MNYAIVYYRTATGYSAHAPDLPGCIAAGFTLEETAELMTGAIKIHIAGLREDGLPVPEPSTIAGTLSAA